MKKTKKQILDRLQTIGIIILIFLALGVLGFRIMYTTNNVIVGDSMYSTLENGEIALVKQKAFCVNIKRGDIIVYNHDQKEVVKRVIGVPGDKIEVTYLGEIYINGESLDETSYLGESYSLSTRSVGLQAYFDITLKDNEYYAMGDNRSISYDCRTYGPIKKDDIIGKLKMIYAEATDMDSEGNYTKKKFVSWRFF